MTADPYQDLPAATRRRTVLRAVLGGFLSTSAASFTEPLTRTDALYFSVLGDLALLGAGVRILLAAARRARNGDPRRTTIQARPPARDNSPHADEVSSMIPGHGG
jgi:hypothetical protein